MLHRAPRTALCAMHVWVILLSCGVQTTFRVGLALLKGVERELLTADFEQVRHDCI